MILAQREATSWTVCWTSPGFLLHYVDYFFRFTSILSTGDELSAASFCFAGLAVFFFCISFFLIIFSKFHPAEPLHPWWLFFSVLGDCCLHYRVAPCGFKLGICLQRCPLFFIRVCTIFISPPQQGQLIVARCFGLKGLIKTRVMSWICLSSLLLGCKKP